MFNVKTWTSKQALDLPQLLSLHSDTYSEQQASSANGDRCEVNNKTIGSCTIFNINKLMPN